MAELLTEAKLIASMTAVTLERDRQARLALASIGPATSPVAKDAYLDEAADLDPQHPDVLRLLADRERNPAARLARIEDAIAAGLDGEGGVAALLPLLRLFQGDRRAGGEGEARPALLLAALVSLGVPDERIFYLVAEAFRRDPIVGAERFAGLRMPEALHVLSAWIGAQHPALATDPRRLCDEFDAVATAIVGLGGTLTVDQAAKHARLRAIRDDRAAATRRLRKDGGRGGRLLPFPTGDDVPAAGEDDDAEKEREPDAEDPGPPGG